MKTANSKAVYRKLMKTYGNSFKSILDYYSLETCDEEIYTKDSVVRQINNRDILDNQKEALALAGSLCKTKDYPEKADKESIVFFSEGYVEAESYPLTSKKVQETIEVLAQKVTRNIINSKRA